MIDGLRVLLVEDSESDAKLVLHALRAGGRQVEHERVEDEAALRAALARAPWESPSSSSRAPSVRRPP